MKTNVVSEECNTSEERGGEGEQSNEGDQEWKGEKNGEEWGVEGA